MNREIEKGSEQKSDRVFSYSYFPLIRPQEIAAPNYTKTHL